MSMRMDISYVMPGTAVRSGSEANDAPQLCSRVASFVNPSIIKPCKFQITGQSIAKGDAVDETTVLKRSEDVTFEIIAGEAILIDMNTGAYFSLNEVGTVFWEKLDGRTPITAHAAAIADEYNQKTADFIAQLRQLATGDGDVARRSQQLAEEYDVNASFIAEQLPHLAGDEEV